VHMAIGAQPDVVSIVEGEGEKESGRGFQGLLRACLICTCLYLDTMFGSNKSLKFQTW